MIRKLALKYADSSGGSSVAVPNFEQRIFEVESFVKTTTKMMHVRVEVMDRKIKSEVGGLRRELSDKIEEKAGEVNHQFEKLDSKSEMLEKKLGAVEFLRKEDLDKIFDDLKNVKGTDNGDGEVSLDEIRMIAKDMLKKDIQRHAADGLGRVDYALSFGWPRGPLTTRQPVEYSWISGNPTPFTKIRQSLLCIGSSTQIQHVPNSLQ